MNFKKGDQLIYYQDLKTTTFLVGNHRFGITMQHTIYMSVFSVFKVWYVFVLFFNSEERITLETSQSQIVTPFALPQSLLYFILYYILFLSRQKRGKGRIMCTTKSTIDHLAPPRILVKWFEKKNSFLQES